MFHAPGVQVVALVPVAGPVPPPIRVVMPEWKASGIWFQTIQKDGAYYQRSWQIGYNGKEENAQDWKIDYVMGSGNHVRTYLHRTIRNTLVELPLAWYAEKGGTWAMNPGFDTDHPLLAGHRGWVVQIVALLGGSVARTA